MPELRSVVRLSARTSFTSGCFGKRIILVAGLNEVRARPVMLAC